MSRFNQKSQTLIETVVATGLIIIALTAIISLSLSSLAYGSQSVEWLIAINLAREGIETCRAIREGNWVNENASWPFGLTDGNFVANAGAISLTTASNSNIDQCGNCRLCLDQTTKQYFHAEASGSCGSRLSTVFRRLINITNITELPDCGGNCEKKITVIIKWIEKGRPHTVSLETRLTNWR